MFSFCCLTIDLCARPAYLIGHDLPSSMQSKPDDSGGAQTLNGAADSMQVNSTRQVADAGQGNLRGFLRASQSQNAPPAITSVTGPACGPAPKTTHQPLSCQPGLAAQSTGTGGRPSWDIRGWGAPSGHAEGYAQAGRSQTTLNNSTRRAGKGIPLKSGCGLNPVHSMGTGISCSGADRAKVDAHGPNLLPPKRPVDSQCTEPPKRPRY